MKISEKTLKWALCFYPPLMFQRIWVRKCHAGFKKVEVKINKSFLNTNSNGSIFGGTIFAATDPFFALMFNQIFLRKGYSTLVWLKSGNIQYIKPGRTSLHFSCDISETDVTEAEEALKSNGKFVKTFYMELRDKNDVLCAVAENEVYMRDKKFKPKDAPLVSQN